ncbi:Piso0_005214 [Millerozyma farinosa CBS 7064]|uniref:Piso0_005214 protein n=1 Tax=Pichia sorbitophila (strain ATCC MYA-4447 / BCRC 22081 / CBS 7064 / NBRC 10061 / NRRL Y-12695) TaxID=559304 RepID=G8Y4I2_PICSO|nr:Piso0_005214 [Millerozyma farinosa CBS 7064]
MFEELQPGEKKVRHGPLKKGFVMAVSWFGSAIFVGTLMLGALIYHLKSVISGKEKLIQPIGEKQAYPEPESLSPVKSLRYCALQLNLDLEEYKITTEDGYILTLHRLIDPKETAADRQSRRPILLQHGLLSCSGSYLSSGYSSLSYFFLKKGYDVWIGNNRAWFEPQHVFYENVWHNELYWDWDVREMAYYDLPCIINNILSHKPNHDQLTLIGHSQGCTQTYLMLKNGNLKEMHRKVNLFVQLAPAVFPGPLFHERAFIKFMHNRSRFMFQCIFGCCCFLRNLGRFRAYFYSFKFYRFLTYIMLKYLFDWNINNWNKNKMVLHLNFIHNVSFVSTKLMNWWLSEWVQEGFSNELLPKEAYDNDDHYAAIPQNANNVPPKHAKSFFPFTESWFTSGKDDVVVPFLVFTAAEDNLVDGRRLLSHLRNYETKAYKEGVNMELHEVPKYNHLDIIWADDAIEVVGNTVADRLSKHFAKESSQEVAVDSLVSEKQMPSIEEPVDPINAKVPREEIAVH